MLFYDRVVHSLCSTGPLSTYLPIRYYHDDNSLSEECNHLCSQVLCAKVLCHQLYLALGDLARYAEQVKERPDWAKAKRWVGLTVVGRG